MKITGGVEWAVHCCVVLSQVERPVPAAGLAELHDVSATYLAKQLQALSRAGLVDTASGRSGGYTLTRDPAQITLLDIVEAIDGAGPTFQCTEIRQRGPLPASPAQCVRPCAINRAMTAADLAWREALREVTVASLAADVTTDYGPEVLRGIRAWLHPQIE